MPPIQRIRAILEAEDRSGRAVNSFTRNISRAENATKRLGDRARGAAGMPRSVRAGDLASPVGKSGSRFRDPQSGAFIGKKVAEELSRSMTQQLRKQNPSLRKMAGGPLAKANQSITDGAVALEKGVQTGADRFYSRIIEAGRQFSQAVKAREAARRNAGVASPSQIQPPASLEQLGFDQQASRQQQAIAQTQTKTDLAQKLRNVSLVNDRDTKLKKIGYQRSLSQDMDRLRATQREELEGAKKGAKRDLKNMHKAQIADQKFSDKERIINFDHEKRLNKERLLNTQKRQKLDLDNSHKLARNELANQQKVERQRIAGLHKEAQTRELQRQRGVQQQMRDTQRSDQQRQRTQQREEQRAQRARQKAAKPAASRGAGMGGFAGIQQGGFFANLSSGTQGLMTAMSLAEGNVMGLAFSLIFLQFASNKTLAVMNALIGTLVLLPGYAIAGALAMGKEFDRTGREIAGMTQNWNDNRQSTLEAIGMVQEYGGEIEENHKALQELARGGYRDVTAEDAKALQSIALLTGESISSVAAKFVDMKKDAKPFFQLLGDSRLGDKTLWDAMPEKYGDSVEEFFKKFKAGEITQEDFIKGSEILGRVAGETGGKLDKSFGGLDRLMEKFAGDIAKSKFGLFEMIEPGAVIFVKALRDIFNDLSGALESSAPMITMFAIAVGDFMVSAVLKGVSIVKSLMSFVGALAGRFKDFIDILISAKPEVDFDISELVGDKMNTKLNALKDRIVEAITNGTDGWGIALAAAFFAGIGFKKTFGTALAAAALLFLGDDIADYFFTAEQQTAMEDALKLKVATWGDGLGFITAGFLITALTTGITRKFALGVLTAHMAKEILGALTDGLVIDQEDPDLKEKTLTIANSVENAASAAILAKFMGKSAFVVGLTAAIAGGISLAAGAITENDPAIMPAMDGLAIGVGLTLSSVIGPGIAKKSAAMATGIGSAIKGAFAKVGTKAGMIALAPLKALTGMVTGIGFSIGSSISAKAAAWTASISAKIGGILAASFARIAAVSGVILGPVTAAIKAMWAGTAVSFIRGIAIFALSSAAMALGLAAIIAGIFIITRKLWEGSSENLEFKDGFRTDMSETVRGMAEEWVLTQEEVMPGMIQSLKLLGTGLHQAFTQHVTHNIQQAILIWRLGFQREMENMGRVIANGWNAIIDKIPNVPSDAPFGLGALASGLKGLRMDGGGDAVPVTQANIKTSGEFQALLRRQQEDLSLLSAESTLVGYGRDPKLREEFAAILAQFQDPALGPDGEIGGTTGLPSILNPSQSVIDEVVSGISLQGIFDSIADMLPDFESVGIGDGGEEGATGTGNSVYEDWLQRHTLSQQGQQSMNPDWYTGGATPGDPIAPTQVTNNINIHLPDGSMIITQDAIDHITNEVSGQMNDGVYRRGGSYLPPVGSQA